LTWGFPWLEGLWRSSTPEKEEEGEDEEKKKKRLWLSNEQVREKGFADKGEGTQRGRSARIVYPLHSKKRIGGGESFKGGKRSLKNSQRGRDPKRNAGEREGEVKDPGLSISRRKRKRFSPDQGRIEDLWGGRKLFERKKEEAGEKNEKKIS